MIIIVGSFTMNPSSTLTLNPLMNGAALLAVEGLATFSGSLILTLDGPPPSSGRLILMNHNGSNGQFNDVKIISSNPSSCDELIYETNALVVLIDLRTCSAPPVLEGIVPWLLMLVLCPLF